MYITWISNEEIKQNPHMLEEIVKIFVGLDKEYTPSLNDRFSNGDSLEEKLTIQIMERVHNGYSFYVVEIDGEIVAFNNHIVEYKEIEGVLYKNLSIGTTGVRLDQQGKGIAKALYTRFEEDAINFFEVDTITRSTWSTNERQLSLYTRFGYNEFDRNLNTWVDGVDTIYFYKVL